MNGMLQTIMERRSIRKYNEKPVTEEQLSDILEAGRYAPTGGNCQTVHFVVITNARIREDLRARVQEAFSEMELSDDQYASIQNSIRLSRRGNYAFDYHAPILVVAANRKGYPNAVADSACALQNMMLEAESMGVGSCWINQLHWLDENPAIRDFLEPLGISNDETICGALALGNYDEKQPVKPRTGMRVADRKTEDYQDIINLPHHVSEHRPHMSMLDRAAQFSPFAALTGYDAAVKETARLTDRRMELNEEEQEKISERLTLLKLHLGDLPVVEITWFVQDERKTGGEYNTVTGVVKKLDEFHRILVMTDGTIIPAEEIVEISGVLFRSIDDTFA